MRLLEHHAKDILTKASIAVPKGALAFSPTEAARISEKLAFPVVMKAQIPINRRLEAGGILFSISKDQASKQAQELFNKAIGGFSVEKILICH